MFKDASIVLIGCSLIMCVFILGGTEVAKQTVRLREHNFYTDCLKLEGDNCEINHEYFIKIMAK